MSCSSSSAKPQSQRRDARSEADQVSYPDIDLFLTQSNGRYKFVNLRGKPYGDAT